MTSSAKKCLAERDELASVSLKVEYWYIHWTWFETCTFHVWHPLFLILEALPDCAAWFDAGSLKNWTVSKCLFWPSGWPLNVYIWNPTDLYFWRSTPPQKKKNNAFSNQKKGRLWILLVTFLRMVSSKVFLWWPPTIGDKMVTAVDHGPLQIATFWGGAPSTFATLVYKCTNSTQPPLHSWKISNTWFFRGFSRSLTRNKNPSGGICLDVPWRKSGSMVIGSMSYFTCLEMRYIRVITHLLTFDTNFLGHPSG